MLVFSPWAFGTTQPWSIWAMNIAGFALGSLLLVKIFLRVAKGYPAMRWESVGSGSGRRSRLLRRIILWLALITLVVLAYCLSAAVNAAASFDQKKRLFEYYDCIRWLPHSFDAHRSWFYFWMYLALAAAFWAVWDWLMGMTDREQRRYRHPDVKWPDMGSRLPARLNLLLWVLCLNGLLLGVEAIFQRAVGSNKLLFIIQPEINRFAASQFGSYAYRSNAAQYFNLLWPVCLGFWWIWHRSGGIRGGLHHVLLLGALVMAACPVISTSRGGALVSVGLLILSAGYLAVMAMLRPSGRRPWLTLVLLTCFSAGAAGTALHFGWDALSERMESLPEGYEGREAMFRDAQPMATDYPLYGTGPGTFATVFQLYRISMSTYWPGQLHNDWLETRITFGWVGMLLLLAALFCLLVRRFVPGGIRGGQRLRVLAWLSLAGCLVHAIYDFPLQVYSILFLFLVICAILFSLSGRRPAASQ